MRIFLSVGDPSGDRHAAHLVRALRDLEPGCEIDALGGPQLERAGARVRHRLTDLPIVGLGGIASRLTFFRRLMIETVAHLKETRTDVLVLVDYPGFNLRLADRARKAGIKTAYFIGPQVWAWGRGRIERIKRSIDIMLVVFEFELDLYKDAGVPVRWVGHPLLDEIDFDVARDFRRHQGFDPDATLLGLLPGSRRSEIERIFPTMLGALAQIRSAHTSLQVAVAVAPGLERSLLESHIRAAGERVTLLEGSAHALMGAADLALVASGTATLETALFGTPQIVLYRTDPVTYLVGKLLVRVPLIGLVNVIAGREVAPEFIQHRCQADIVAAESIRMLGQGELAARGEALATELKGKLGEPGASGRAATAIMELACL